MQTKLFEIRDKATFIPVICTLMVSDDDVESYLLRRSGYGPDGALVLMSSLYGEDNPSTCEPYHWRDRTRHTAHKFIVEHWNSLPTGSVIDVEHILGEAPFPKVSERLS